MNWRDHMVAKSHIRGHEVSWNDRLMQWEFKDGSTYKTIPFEDVPEEWLDRCSGEGHERDIDSEGNTITYSVDHWTLSNSYSGSSRGCTDYSWRFES